MKNIYSISSKQTSSRKSKVDNRNNRHFYFLFLLQLCSLYFLIIDNWIMAVGVILIPLILYMVLDQNTTIIILVFSLFIGYYFVEEPVGIRAVDVMAALIIIALIINRSIRKDVSLFGTILDKPIFLFLVAISISVIDAPFQLKAFINLLRHIELFVVFYFLVDMFRRLKKINLKTILDYYIIAAVFASSVAIILLILNGDNRAFGITGTPLSDLVVSASLICSVQILTSKSHGQIAKYAVFSFLLLLELLLTQTRGAWLSFSISFLFIGYLMYRKNVTHAFFRYVFFLVLISFAFVISVIFFKATFLGFTHRIEQLQNIKIGTIYSRIILWEAAINAFLSHPINGIGIGQFTLLSGKYSILGQTALFKDNIQGLSTHNIVLSYLAETGILGIISLLYLQFSLLKLGLKNYYSALGVLDTNITMSLAVVLFFICTSSFYAGAWFWSINGMQFMIIMALSTAYAAKRK